MPSCKVKQQVFYFTCFLYVAVSACLFFRHSPLVFVCGEGALTGTATAAAAADCCNLNLIGPLAVVVAVVCLLLV